jgi:hypothetical protein
VIAVTEPHDWPFEQPAEGTLRPWYLTATGYLMVLFSHPEEAQRARSGLLQHQVSQEDIRLYESQEILRILARAQAQRSILAKAVFRSGRRPVSQATSPGQRPHRRRRPCPTCDQTRGIINSEKLPPNPARHAAEHHRLTVELDHARGEYKRRQKRADSARRRVDNLEAQLLALGAITDEGTR